MDGEGDNQQPHEGQLPEDQQQLPEDFGGQDMGDMDMGGMEGEMDDGQYDQMDQQNYGQIDPNQ